MTKAEILSKMLSDMAGVPFQTQPSFRHEPDEEDFFIPVLRDVLPEVDISTCEDFRHLKVECRRTGHDYQHYESSILDLPNGANAWVFETVKSRSIPRNILNSSSGGIVARS